MLLTMAVWSRFRVYECLILYIVLTMYFFLVLALWCYGFLSSLSAPERQNCWGGLLEASLEQEANFKYAFIQRWRCRRHRLMCLSCPIEASTLMHYSCYRMQSYTIDFGCVRTKAALTGDEWSEMAELNDFQPLRLPESTERYLYGVRKALVKG